MWRVFSNWTSKFIVWGDFSLVFKLQVNNRVCFFNSLSYFATKLKSKALFKILVLDNFVQRGDKYKYITCFR